MLALVGLCVCVLSCLVLNSKASSTVAAACLRMRVCACACVACIVCVCCVYSVCMCVYSVCMCVCCVYSVCECVCTAHGPDLNQNDAIPCVYVCYAMLC